MKRIFKLVIIIGLLLSLAACSTIGIRSGELHPGHPGHEVH